MFFRCEDLSPKFECSSMGWVGGVGVGFLPWCPLSLCVWCLFLCEWPARAWGGGVAFVAPIVFFFC